MYKSSQFRCRDSGYQVQQCTTNYMLIIDNFCHYFPPPCDQCAMFSFLFCSFRSLLEKGGNKWIAFTPHRTAVGQQHTEERKSENTEEQEKRQVKDWRFRPLNCNGESTEDFTFCSGGHRPNCARQRTKPPTKIEKCAAPISGNIVCSFACHWPVGSARAQIYYRLHRNYSDASRKKVAVCLPRLTVWGPQVSTVRPFCPPNDGRKSSSLQQM